MPGGPKLLTLTRLGCLLASVLLPATLLHAALSAPDAPAQRGSVAGQLLIASPSMSDPRFYQTVVLMVRHDHNGAFGIAINRPVQERSLASLLAAVGDNDSPVEGSVRIFAGGPVQPEIGFVLHSADYARPTTVSIDGHVAMTGGREILRDIANKHGPEKFLIAFGYAGWAPTQLEGELAQGFWFTAPEDTRLVFDLDRDKVWDDAVKRRTQDL
jgi:putative transcriptional regulator